MTNILNFIIFQSVWFLTAWSIPNNMPEIGPIITLTVASLYLVIFNNKLFKLKLYLFAAVLGFVVDTILIHLNAISFPLSNTITSPMFMVCLWINFVITFEYCLSWIHRSLVNGMILAFLGAPLSYYTGEKMGALILHKNIIFSLTSIGLLWVISMGVLMILYKKWKPQ